MHDLACIIVCAFSTFKSYNNSCMCLIFPNAINYTVLHFTFIQMRETNFIVQNIRDCSLVVIDELGRGTSREEGVGICYAVCEQLLQTKVATMVHNIYCLLF